MDALKSLYWNQGLFLKPQHFQHLNSHTSAIAKAYTNLITNKTSGISQLQFDKQAIQSGIASIEKLTCILADGTLLSFPGNSNIEPLRIDTSAGNEDGNIEIYIALASLKNNTSNVGESNSNARYIKNDINDVVDAFNTQETADLEVVEFNCKLITAEQLANHTSHQVLKIAELSSNAQGVSYSDSYIPDVFMLQASDVLQARVAQIKQSLVGRYAQLESISSSQLSISNNATNANLVLAMSMIAGYIAQFSQFEDDLSTEPGQVYLAIRQLVSQLSIFSSSVSVTGEVLDADYTLLPYKSSNLTECFTRASKLINKVLNELTVEPELIVELGSKGAGQFVAELTNDFISSDNQVYLRLRSESLVEEMKNNIALFAKLGADGQVDVYQKRSLPGVGLTYLPNKPVGVEHVSDAYYFNLDRHSFQWDKVTDVKRLGFIWNDAPADLVVELVAVRG